eukprot:15123893-Alexandrium_andersonii.AAC.1
MTIRAPLLSPLLYALALRQARQAKASPSAGVNTGPWSSMTACIIPVYRQPRKLASTGGRCGNSRATSAPAAPTA